MSIIVNIDTPVRLSYEKLCDAIIEILVHTDRQHSLKIMFINFLDKTLFEFGS